MSSWFLEGESSPILPDRVYHMVGGRNELQCWMRRLRLPDQGSLFGDTIKRTFPASHKAQMAAGKYFLAEAQMTRISSTIYFEISAAMY